MYSELIEGIDVLDENGEVVGQSKAAARSAITQVTLSRIIMATPGMGNGSFFYTFFRDLNCLVSFSDRVLS